MHNKGSYPRIDFRAISCLRFSSTHTHLEHSSTGRHMKGSQSRMRRIFLIGFTILASNAVWAGGPWTEKSYKDWDRNDVRKVLFDSPWVSHFVRTRRALEFEVPDQGPSGMELRGYHSKESKEDDAQTTEFYVRWVSSRTLREAWARKLVLQKRVSENEIDKYLPPSSDEFEIVVEGPDMSPFQQVRKATLQAKGYLTISSRQKIAPTRVEFARSHDGQIRGILFFFPRRTATGEPTISTHARSVRFVERGGNVDIIVTFYPQKMADKGGVDL